MASAELKLFNHDGSVTIVEIADVVSVKDTTGAFCPTGKICIEFGIHSETYIVIHQLDTDSERAETERAKSNALSAFRGMQRIETNFAHSASDAL